VAGGLEAVVGASTEGDAGSVKTTCGSLEHLRRSAAAEMEGCDSRYCLRIPVLLCEHVVNLNCACGFSLRFGV
jgi:hypothetical protein